MKYYYPFGEELKPVVQKDQTPKKVFVLGVYASAVHAKWICNGKVICNALAIASEPTIFWNGNIEEAKFIIDGISFPSELGKLEPAGSTFNGPSGRVLINNILSPLGFTRKDAWLCDLLPETRLNGGQVKAIKREYEPRMEKYGLNPVTIPPCPTEYCDEKRIREILAELWLSQADLLILLGDIPIKQFLNKVVKVDFHSLQEYKNAYGYGMSTEVMIDNRVIKVLPLAHPRQIGALGSHSDKWYMAHQEWMKKIEADNCY